MILLESMHKEIETIFKGNVDHIHCDMLHRFIDRQATKIEELEARVGDLTEAVQIWRKAKYEADHRQFHARADRKKADDKVVRLEAALRDLTPNHPLL